MSQVADRPTSAATKGISHILLSPAVYCCEEKRKMYFNIILS